MHRPAPRLVFIFFTVLLDVLGIGLIIPVGPRLVEQLLGLPPSGRESEAALPVGLLSAVYAAMLFVFSPVMGSLADRFGRRPVILVALLGSGIDYLASALAPTLSILFVTRMLNGVSGANITACNAYIADITPPEKRGGAYGVLGAAFGLGFVLGPVLGGLLGDARTSLPLVGHGSVRLPFVCAGVLTLINCLYGLLVLPESLPPERRRAFDWSRANPLGAFRWLADHRVVIALAACFFLLNVAQFGLHATWVLSMGARFGWKEREVGWSLFTVGVTAALVQGGLARKLIPALGERACLLGGLIIGVLAFAGYGLAPQGWMVYAIIAVASLGGVSQPAAQAIVSKAVPPTEQGLLQGAMTGLQSVAGIIGPLLGSVVFRQFTREGAGVHLPGAPFLLGSALTALAMVPVFLIWNRMPSTPSLPPDENAPATAGH
jgi:DHA1 family tetracycline resistance protein-like MFS transporter